MAKFSPLVHSKTLGKTWIRDLSTLASTFGQAISKLYVETA